MYPLGLAGQRDTPDGRRGDRFCFLLQEEKCRGFDEPQEWTVRQWFDDQGIGEYDEWGEAFKELKAHGFLSVVPGTNRTQVQLAPSKWTFQDLAEEPEEI